MGALTFEGLELYLYPSELDLGLLQNGVKKTVSDRDYGGLLMGRFSMGRTNWILVLALSLMTTLSFAEEVKPSAPAAEAQTQKEITYLICKHQSAVRTLRVQNRDNGSCFTTYTKSGVDQIVSSSKENQTCFKVLSNIRENLEKASWKCKDISEARVSSALD